MVRTKTVILTALLIMTIGALAIAAPSDATESGGEVIDDAQTSVEDLKEFFAAGWEVGLMIDVNEETAFDAFKTALLANPELKGQNELIDYILDHPELDGETLLSGFILFPRT